MNIKKLLCLVSAIALGATLSAQTQQSLPELAKAEKARRAKLEKAGTTAKTYTESDRTGGGTEVATADAGTSGPGGPPGAPAASGSKKKEKTPEDLAADKQKEFDGKVKQTNDQIKNLEDTITRNERILTSMYNITPARQDVINSIESDKKKLADLKQTLVSLEDERRRAGMPRR